MTTLLIQSAIDAHMTTHSGFEPHRDYLGMSHINDCPRKIAREMINGTPVTEITHRMCYAGYEQEVNILTMLEIAGIAKRVERLIVAPFDSRFRGHIDAETMDGDLLEIKSVSTAKFKKITEERRPLFSHAVQVQMYMFYGKYERGFIVYRNRETYEHVVFEEHPSPQKAYKYELKAKIVLDALDGGLLPLCECGRCE